MSRIFNQIVEEKTHITDVCWSMIRNLILFCFLAMTALYSADSSAHSSAAHAPAYDSSNYQITDNAIGTDSPIEHCHKSGDVFCSGSASNVDCPENLVVGVRFKVQNSFVNDRFISEVIISPAYRPPISLSHKK